MNLIFSGYQATPLFDGSLQIKALIVVSSVVMLNFLQTLYLRHATKQKGGNILKSM